MSATAWSQLGWFVLVATVWTLFVLMSPVDWDYTSGELLDHLVSWGRSGVLYPTLEGAPPHRVLNYPPLVFLGARGAQALGIHPLLSGRLINSLGLLLLVAAVTGWTRARGASGTQVAGTVGLLGASFPVLYAAGQFHIELWAVAFTVGGYALLATAGARKTAALGGLALALACFSKQTQVVPALVALAWAWTYRRQAAGPATVSFATAGMAGSLAITLAWGAEPWTHMLRYTVGTLSLSNFGLQVLLFVAPWGIFLAWMARDVRRGGRGALADAVVWYWLGALVWSLSALRMGSSFQYFLDLHLATALWVGPKLFEAGSLRSRAWAGAMTAQVVVGSLAAGMALGAMGRNMKRVETQLPVLCQAMGPGELALAEYPGVIRACGHTPLLHPFIMTSLAQQGLWNPSSLEGEVRAGAYGSALLRFDPREDPPRGHAPLWTPGMLAAFRDAGTVDLLAPGWWAVRW